MGIPQRQIYKIQIIMKHLLTIILLLAFVFVLISAQDSKPKVKLNFSEPPSDEFVKAIKEINGLNLAKESYYSIENKNIPKHVKAYINRFYKTAKAESQYSQQPASVKLAQGIVESSWGNSELTKKTNNHFGIKCFKKDCKPDHCIKYDDDKPTDRFKVYKSAWFSYRDHTRFIQKNRYSKCKSDNYKKWCECLQSKGYATNKKYTELLINVIESYRLYEFDKK